MTGLWDIPSVPHKGWQCINVVDLNPDDEEDCDYASCEMCGREQIRFVHQMQHPGYPSGLDVGRVCAQKMSDDYIGPRSKEKQLLNKSTRRKRWLSRNWRTSRNGNSYLRISKLAVIVFPGKFGKWSFVVAGHPGSKWFATKQEAQLAAFEQFEIIKSIPKAIPDYES